MKQKLYIIFSLILIITLSFSVLSNNVTAEDTTTDTTAVFANKAFPTAKGFGTTANAWRGGRVIEVTNLNDSGEGSLRWALEEETGPRIVVFKVGGVIELKSLITIGSNNGEVYIAGQTAPGDGITIKGAIRFLGVNNVIIRHLRVRTGSSYAPSNCLRIQYSKNIVIDHCSLSWGAYGCVELDHSENITFQYCIIAEGLNDVYTLIDDGGAWSYKSVAFQIHVNKASFHHNLITNCSGSIWCTHNMNSIVFENKYSDEIDIRNNVVYNGKEDTMVGFCHNTQFINNYYKNGPITDNYKLIKAFGMGYLSGNKVIDIENSVIVNDTDNQSQLVSENAFSEGLSNWELFAVDVSTQTADQAYENVLNNAGATVPSRDYFDTRYVKEVSEGTYTYGNKGIIESQTETEGYPDNTTFTGGEAPVDTDHDGMPDEWEVEHGLDPDNYYDACQVYLSDNGYTNVELYINELAGDPVSYSDNPVIQYTPVIPTSTPVITETPEPTFTPTPTETEIPTKIPVVAGDVNFDDIVDAADALLILKHAAKLEILTEKQLNVSDLNKDLITDASDALNVLKIATKIY